MTRYINDRRNLAFCSWECVVACDAIRCEDDGIPDLLRERPGLEEGIRAENMWCAACGRFILGSDANGVYPCEHTEEIASRPGTVVPVDHSIWCECETVHGSGVRLVASQSWSEAFWIRENRERAQRAELESIERERREAERQAHSAAARRWCGCQTCTGQNATCSCATCDNHREQRLRGYLRVVVNNGGVPPAPCEPIPSMTLDGALGILCAMMEASIGDIDTGPDNSIVTAAMIVISHEGGHE